MIERRKGTPVPSLHSPHAILYIADSFVYRLIILFPALAGVIPTPRTPPKKPHTIPRTRRVLTEGKRTKQNQGGEKRGSMRAKYIGKTDFLVLTHGKLYEILSVEKDWYRVVDDSGEDYLYPPELFELLED